jgi:tetratricopeptide (TPR) repeat protein
MRVIRILAVVAVALLALSSCNRDPNVAKKRYLESGNRYFEKGKYREAILMYRDALQKDRRYGLAHYRLGLTYLKMNSVTEGVRSFRRALEFLGPNDPERWDATVKMTSIFVTLGGRDKQLQAEAETNCKLLLARDPNSFDGHHLTGELQNVRAMEDLRTGDRDEGKKLLDAALEEYQKADSIKPNQVGVMVEIAGVYALQENFDAAGQMYRKVLAADKSYLMAYISLYQLAIRQKQLDVAEQVLKEGYQNNPKEFTFLERLALLYFAEKRNDDMLKALQEIKAHAKEYPAAYMEVGDFYYFRLGDAESGIREYREGMAKDPKRKAAYQKHIIEVLMRQGKRSEAAAINDQILKDNPDDPDAKSLDASLKLDKGDILRAQTELQQVVTQNPDNPVAHFNLGRAYAMRQEWEQARQQFARAIELRGDYLPAHIALAQLQAARGDFAAAIKAAQQALAVDPNNLSALLIQAASLINLKRFPEAHAMLDALLVRHPNSQDILYQMAVLLLSENKYKEAEATFRKVYDLNTANPRGLLGLTEAYMIQGKADQALTTLQTESAKAPARIDLQLLLADAAARTGRFDMAIQYYQHVVDSMDKGARQRADIMLRMGEAYRRKGDLQNAIVCLEKAREVHPESIMVLSNLALVLDQAARWEEARKVYEVALKLDPNNAIALNNLAYLEAEHGGDLNQAQTLAQRAKELLPNRPEVSDTLGWIYLKRNLPDNASDIFTELVRANPHSSTFRYHLGEAFEQKGDKQGAVRELTAALHENPPAAEEKNIRDLLRRLGQ